MAPEDSASSTRSSLYHLNVNSSYGSELETQSNGVACPEKKRRSEQNGNGAEAYQKIGTRLSDTHLATRKAEEAASRRFQASLWLQEMVGPFHLSVEPTEEEFRLCLRNGLWLCKVINIVHPGAVSKVVEYSVPSSPSEGALSAYQHFENVRNFLVAVNNLKLPSFEASDLEQSSLLTGSIAKVVDCILAVKAYYEWRQNGGLGPWKLGLPLKSSSGIFSCSKGPTLNGLSNLALSYTVASKNENHPRKKWALPDPEYLGEKGAPLPEDAGGKVRRSSAETSNGSSAACLNEIETGIYSMDMSDPTSAWIHHIGMKLHDAIQMKSETDQKISIVENPGAVNGQKCRSSQSLLSLVKAVLGDKEQEEIPMLVEFMLSKVMEGFERQIFYQGEQKKKLEIALNDALKKENKPSTFQALSDGEGLKVLSDQLQQIKELKLTHLNTRQEVLNMKSCLTKEMKDFELYFQKVAIFAGGYQRVLAENRQLYNQVQDLKGNIRVYCRVKPLSGQVGEQGTIEYIGENGEMMVVNPKKQGKDVHKSFSFNKVFGPSASQEDVFLDTQPLMRSVLDGYNVCIFAYGQTGSGKTFTMSGPSGGSEKLLGVNYRALNDLFHISQIRKDVFKYEVSVQMVEIYNEQVRDLFAFDSPNKKLEIRNSQQNGMNVPNAIMKHVNSTADVLELMRVGQKNRAVGSTAMNERSSRSHSVLTIHVQGTELSTGSVLRGCLHLVDLAGSERVDKSEATGERLREAQHINKSLSALGDVISALIQKNSHIPYRNSKLTQLLQDSLGGQAKTMMFVHVNPESDSYGETISTLKFAERVASVELGAARSNKECGEVLELKEQLRSLRDALAKKEAEIERLSAQKSLRTSTQEASFSFEKLKMRTRRSSTEEFESRTQLQLLEETETTPQGCPSQESYSDQIVAEAPAPSPSAGEDQASLYANTVKQKVSTEKWYYSSPKCSPMDRGSLTPETVTHYRSKIPRRLEPRASPRRCSDQSGKRADSCVFSMPVQQARSKLSLESSVTPDSYHSEALRSSPGSWEKSAERKENDCELDDSVNSDICALQESPFDSFQALESRLSDAALQQKLDGRRFRRSSQPATDSKSYSHIEIQQSATPVGGTDAQAVRVSEPRQFHEVATDTGLPLAVDNALKPRRSPFSSAQSFQFSQLRSPLQIQKPRNDRRLSLAGPAEGQRSLRRSLVLGAPMAPGMDKSIPKRPSIGVRASLDLRPAPFSSENAALESHGKYEVSRQLPAIQTGVSPRSSKRWL
ncbi:hypothetical protein O6H91_20G039400 [Diphasiastrum complanatum]|uniref:Uncharacterized protein n=1 Tax=Diphasiastrum complanatum TaxID=34168 RepID=A0ACC2APG3_DIPCM|nr:hypothetical protein O6H91_20G039400 [Diphasiastrum complanatum]